MQSDYDVLLEKARAEQQAVEEEKHKAEKAEQDMEEEKRKREGDNRNDSLNRR